MPQFDATNDIGSGMQENRNGLPAKKKKKKRGDK